MYVSATSMCVRCGVCVVSLTHSVFVGGLGAEVAVAEVADAGQDVEFFVDFWI